MHFYLKSCGSTVRSKSIALRDSQVVRLTLNLSDSQLGLGNRRVHSWVSAHCAKSAVNELEYEIWYGLCLLGKNWAKLTINRTAGEKEK